MPNKLRAGVSIIDISPGTGHELAGYPHNPRYNTGIHDPLFAGCIFLDDGTTKLVFITMDLLFFSKKYVRQSRKRISDLTGIPGKNIMFCCSHTHSGPWCAGRLDFEALEKGLGADMPYVEELQDKLSGLVQEACSNTFEARVGMGKGRCGREQGVGGNRRSKSGLSDPEVCVLGIKDADNCWKGCLVIYALHPTVIHSESTVVTADYPGYIRKYLKLTKPGMVLLFAQGTSGDQSTRFFREGQTFEEACRIGTTIGVEVGRVLDSLEFSSFATLWVESQEIGLELRSLPRKEEAMEKVRKLEAEFKRLQENHAPYVEQRTAEVKLLGAEDILGYVILNEKGIKPELLVDELPVEVQVLGIGDGRIVGLQGEVFVEHGLNIKKGSPFANTFVIELANGVCPGYVYTRESLREGGYETDTSMLRENSGDILVGTALDMLEQTIT